MILLDDLLFGLSSLPVVEHILKAGISRGFSSGGHVDSDGEGFKLLHSEAEQFRWFISLPVFIVIVLRKKGDVYANVNSIRS